VSQHGSPPRRPGRPPTPGRGGPGSGGRNSWDVPYDTDDPEDLPPWAGLGVHTRRPGPDPRQRPVPSREERDYRDPDSDAGGDRAVTVPRRERAPASGRGTDRGPGRSRGPGGHGHRGSRVRAEPEAGRSRKPLIIAVWGVAAVVVAAIAFVVINSLGGSPPRPRALPPGIVTTFQPGEFRAVPNACTSVTAATLDQYLSGTRRVVQPRSLFGHAQSLCVWTKDAPPVYRVLQVTVQAYAPSGLAGGNGSATANATGIYQQAMQGKLHPAKASHLPKATVTKVAGIGDEAFAALQVVKTPGDTTDLLTVVTRDHNVVVTVVLQGIDRSTGNRYGPVSPAALEAGAVAAAKDVIAKLY
jgi:hypothetical protein